MVGARPLVAQQRSGHRRSPVRDGVHGPEAELLRGLGAHPPRGGGHPAIAENATYSPQYPIEESTVFGDLFSSPTPLLGILPAFQVYVCWESLLPQSCGVLGLPLLF